MKKLIEETLDTKTHHETYLLLQNKTLCPEELEELAQLDRESLENLMHICRITAFNGCPVVALTDNEIRMAYCVWRGYEINERRAPLKLASARIKSLTDFLKTYIEKGYF